MKELKDSELLDLAWKNLSRADKHLYSTIVLVIIGLIQSILLMFNFVGIVSFLIIYPVSFLLYLYHKKKQEKYMNVVKEALDELTSRGI
jgi:pilus assembly protein TadC